MPDVAGYVDWFALLVATTAIVAAALSDGSRYLIPNRYPAAIVVAFCVFAIGKPMHFWLPSLVVGVVLLALGTVFFARGIMGGGDVKLLSAVGLWAGLERLELLMLVMALVGGVLALIKLIPFQRLAPASPEIADTGWRAWLQYPIPYGIAIAAGGVSVALSHVVS
jgi:prepilin peptidase CpaA